MNKLSFETILLVEDNPGDARWLREMFEQGARAAELVAVASLREAEEYVASHAVDLVMLDLGLPDAQGIEAVRRVRAASPAAALVILTGLDDSALAAQALREGAQDYLVKDEIETRWLMRALRYAIERKSMEDAAGAMSAHLRGFVDLDRNRAAIADFAIATSNAPEAPGDEEAAFLSTGLAGRRAARFALAAMAISLAIFLVAAPFARTPLAQVSAFTPIYVSALVICDLITAVLLFGQFSFLRARSLLLLASGYLFTALITSSYVLMFPGLFAPTGLLGAGPQSTSAMYMFWHAGFPLVVIGYTLLRRRKAANVASSGPPSAATRFAILSAVGLALAVVVAFTLFVTVGHGLLPSFIEGNRTTDLGRATLSSVWLLSLLAFLLLWRQRARTAIDLWLTVVTGVWLFDIALSAILNSGRYDLGWYVGRLYGLIAASFLLAVMLIENSRYYAKLVGVSTKLRSSNQILERMSLLDGLTNLANRRYFDAYIANQVAVARRHNRALALVLYDVDAFKAYNDNYGHQAGDECLKQVSIALQSCCRRPADLVARYGGEEFAMILPDTDLAGAARIAEAARDAVAQLKIPHSFSPAAGFVSISGGIAIVRLKESASAQQLITAADRTLYQAKQSGRNRIVSAQTAAA